MGATPTGVGFLVVGWYSDPDADPLAAIEFPPGATAAARRRKIARALGWETGLPTESLEVPGRAVLSGVLYCVPWDGRRRIQPHAPKPVTVAVGNTTAEAVAALLAQGEPEVEELLNQFQLGLLNRRGPSQPPDPDFPAEAEEAAHAARFGSRPAGGVWTLRRPAGESRKGTDPTLEAVGAMRPPAVAAPLLSALNQAQATLDGLQHDLHSRRRQLFADWYRYMRLQYPEAVHAPHGLNADKLQRLIHEHVCPDIDTAVVAVTGQAATVKRAKAALDAALQADGTGWVANRLEAPRYCQPNDPVLLLSGADLQPSDRYGDARGRLACRLSGTTIASLTITIGNTSHAVVASDLPGLPPTNGSLPAEAAALLAEALLLDPLEAPTLAGKALQNGAPGDAPTLSAQIQAAQEAVANGTVPPAPVSFTGRAPASLAVTHWTQPWIPLLLDWRVGVRPVDKLAPARAYPADLLESLYQRGANGLDLELKGAPPATTVETYTGTIVLAGRTGINLKTQLEKYLTVNPGGPHAAELKKLSENLDPHAMAQALNGFNAALLMRSQTIQIPVGDPLAFAQPQVGKFEVPTTFSDDDVKTRVGRNNDSAPDVGAGFDPLRAGVMTVMRLRVIDAFGQVREYKDLEPPRVASSLGSDAVPKGSALLPPRLTQPARLLFRWRSASDDRVESNTSPETTPVCGWVLYNHLDDDLAVYDADGNAVGSVEMPLAKGSPPQWQGAPGTPAFGRGTADAIANLHLRAFVEALSDPKGDDSYLAALLETIDTTMTTVNPLGFEQDQPLSVLIGQPLAVVRASLRLELQGLPAPDQSWEALRATEGAPAALRPDGGIRQFRVPVTIGEPGKLGDGVVGYVVDDGSPAAYKKFYAPVPPTRKQEHVRAVDPTVTAPTARASSDATPDIALTILMDPRGSAHALSGVLPVVAMSIPPALYRDALGRLAVTFLTTPVLAPAAATPTAGAPAPPFPLPPEPGLSWSWLRRDPGGTTWSLAPVTQQATPDATLVSPQHLEEGWLRLSRPGR